MADTEHATGILFDQNDIDTVYDFTAMLVEVGFSAASVIDKAWALSSEIINEKFGDLPMSKRIFQTSLLLSSANSKSLQELKNKMKGS
ncbi:MAG TPA: hypothetical protein VL443_08095 [Cyclobacteriaceae bacterium]|jgi:hypothetical protein|nr:hypothetical protein [Cyclobacteriaceae bacterium]